MTITCRPAVHLGLVVVLGFSVIDFAAAAPGASPVSVASATPVDPNATTRERLFRQVFKHAPPRIPINCYVLVVVDGTTSEKVKAMPAPDSEEVLLDGRTLVALLSPSLPPETIRQLEQSIDAQGWLSAAGLETVGLSVSFNLRKFRCAIEIPPAKRAKRVEYLNRPALRPSATQALNPAPVSGYLNFNLKGTLGRENLAPAASNKTNLALVSDGAINVRGVVLEGTAFGQAGDRNRIQRGDLRLVYDVPPRALRFTLGDLDYASFGYEHRVDMLGIGVAKDFSLQPYVSTYRSGEFEFYLDHPAEVKMWVNNSLVSTQQLSAGAHDIRGLMPAIGQNDMRLLIEDSAGRRQILNFSFIFDPVLLEKGRSVFSYDAGFRRTLVDGDYRYDWKQPVASASYLRGLTDVTSVGGYAQSDPSRSLLGARVLHIVSPGTLRLDVAGSRSEHSRFGTATTAELTSTPTSFGLQSQVAAEYLSNPFNSMTLGSTRSDNTLNLRASVAMRINRTTTAQLSNVYAFSRARDGNDSHLVSGTLIHRWGRFITGTASLRNRRPNHGHSVTELLVGLSISFSRGGSDVYAAKELESNTVTAQWQTERPSNRNTPYVFASTRTGSGDKEYEAGAGYWSSQGIAEASYSRNEFEQGGRRTTHDEATLRLQGGLVFAGTTVGLSRPVLDNFAIVTGKEGLAHVDLKVDPDGNGGSRANSSWLSPAVVGSLPSYRIREMAIEPIDPPLGATPEKLTFALAPTYKSGFLVKVGKESSLVATGRLVDQQGKPLVHLTLEIHRLGDTAEMPATTFTSRSGTFQLSDIKPGRYEIRASSEEDAGNVTIEIQPSRDGLYRLGDVVLSKQL